MMFDTRTESRAGELHTGQLAGAGVAAREAGVRKMVEPGATMIVAARAEVAAAVARAAGAD